MECAVQNAISFGQSTRSAFLDFSPPVACVVGVLDRRVAIHGWRDRLEGDSGVLSGPDASIEVAGSNWQYHRCSRQRLLPAHRACSKICSAKRILRAV